MAIIYEKRDISFEAFFVPMDFYPHIHETLEIIYLCEGEVTITIGSSSKTLHAGELSIVFPNIVHSYHSTQPNYVLTVIFSPELVEIITSCFFPGSQNALFCLPDRFILI